MNKRTSIIVFQLTVGIMLLTGVTIGSSLLGEWSTDCTPGFRLAAMPSSWAFDPSQGPVTITTRVAIDYQRLNTDAWITIGDPSDGGYFELIGYRQMLLEAQIRPLGVQETIITLNGAYSIDRGKDPVIFTWDGRDESGLQVAPGDYEIEVRGRFVPAETPIMSEDGITYGDLDRVAGTEEACTRILTIKVSTTPGQTQNRRGVGCAPPPRNFWMSVDATNATTLRATLHPLIDDHTLYPYSSTSTDTWDILNDADENPSAPTELLTVYRNEGHVEGCSSDCVWNREHTWAKSYGFSEDTGNGRIPYTDCHHLRATNPSYNSARSNLPHNVCPQPCTEYTTYVNNGFGGGAADVNWRRGSAIFSGSTPNATDVWETWPHRKGDVARSVLYMDIRYEGDTGDLGPEQDLIATDDLGLMLVETTSGGGDGYQDPAYHGVLSALVAWNESDPPDSDEIRRNDQVWCYQGNRNPWVDHPEWVNCLYSGTCTSGPTFMGIGNATDENPCQPTGVNIAWTTPQHWNDGCLMSCTRGYRVLRNGIEITTGGCNSGALGEASISCIDDAGSQQTVYTYSVEAYNDNGHGNDGGFAIDGVDSVDDTSPPVITNGPTSVAGPDGFTALWNTDEASDSFLQWSTTQGGPYSDSTANSALVTSHSLAATGLNGQTTYYYRTCSSDVCGNGPTCSAEAEVTIGGGCDPGDDTGVFINELHYDNNGPDSNEGIEIAGPSGTDLTGWSIEAYDGNGGGLSAISVPNPAPLVGFIDDEGTGYGALWFPIDDLDNGPDGLALIDDAGTVVQFLCYEGLFTATAGTANGMTCTDIGISEPTSTGADDSLQLTGGPSFVYEEFTWAGPATNSHGVLNTGQVMECSTEEVIFTDGFESSTTSAWSATVS